MIAFIKKSPLKVETSFSKYHFYYDFYANQDSIIDIICNYFFYGSSVNGRSEINTG